MQEVGRAMWRSELMVLVGRVASPRLVVRWRVRRMLAVPLSRSRSSQRRPRSSPLRRPVRWASSNSAACRSLGGGEELSGLVGGEGVEAAGAGCSGADVSGDVARDLFFAHGVFQGGFEHGVDVGER